VKLKLKVKVRVKIKMQIHIDIVIVIKILLCCLIIYQVSLQRIHELNAKDSKKTERVRNQRRPTFRLKMILFTPLTSTINLQVNRRMQL